MFITKENTYKTYRGTDGWAKGLIFKVVFVDADKSTVDVVTYNRKMSLPFSDFSDVTADEVV